MGPRLDGRGDDHIAEIVEHPAELQWGRASMGAVMPKDTSEQLEGVACFNGAAPRWAR